MHCNCCPRWSKNNPLNKHIDLQESLNREQNKNFSVKKDNISDNSITEDFLSRKEGRTEDIVPTPNQSKRGHGSPKIIRAG